MIRDGAWPDVVVGGVVAGLVYVTGIVLGDPTLIVIGGVGIGFSVGRAAWLVLESFGSGR